MAAWCTSQPTKSVGECGLADLRVKVHDGRAVMMRLWPAPGSPAVAPEVSLPSWKSLCLGHTSRFSDCRPSDLLGCRGDWRLGLNLRAQAWREPHGGDPCVTY